MSLPPKGILYYQEHESQHCLRSRDSCSHLVICSSRCRECTRNVLDSLYHKNLDDKVLFHVKLNAQQLLVTLMAQLCVTQSGRPARPGPSNKGWVWAMEFDLAISGSAMLASSACCDRFQIFRPRHHLFLRRSRLLPRPFVLGSIPNSHLGRQSFEP